MAALRIGLLSSAHVHAAAWVACLRQRPEVTLLGVADEDAARGREFAAQQQLPCFDSYTALLSERPEAVVICSENARHPALVELAAAAGAHILCEKPLATTAAAARQMLARCEAAGVTLMTAFPMRFSPPVIAAREALLAGDLGRIYGCNATNQGQLPLAAPWFIDPDLAGGGALMDHIVHVADLLRWFFGSEVREVYAQANRILYRELQPRVETGGIALLDFANGSFASIDCSWSRPPNYPTWGNVKLEIVGEGGLLSLDAFRQASTVYRDGAPGAELAYWGSDANQGLIDEFVTALTQGRAPAISGHDGVQASAIAEAALMSAHSGEPVRI